MSADSLRQVTTVPTLPAVDDDAHKGTFGTVTIVAGRDGMLGAAILCARGALRGGAGLVRVAVDGRDLRAALASAVPAATSTPRDGPVRGWCGGARVVAIGPGLGTDDAGRRAVAAVREGAAELGASGFIVDADALNVLAALGDPRWPDDAAPAIYTPHPGEAARLLGTEPAAIQRDRRAAVRQLVERTGAVCVLKGAGTLVCDGRRLFCNTTGNPGMGTGGVGDVLTGLIAAIRSRGLDAFEAACLAVHVHGRAGDAVARERSQPGLVAEDMPEAIAALLGEHGSPR